jgi:hypothetical protein
LPITEETRALLSISKSGANNPMFGVDHTPEARLAISKAQAGVSRGPKEPTGAIKQYWQRIGQYSLTGQLLRFFDSVKLAATALGVTRASIQRAINSPDGQSGFNKNLYPRGR